MRMRALSVGVGLFALAALAWSPGAASVGEADGPGARGTGFRGVTIQTGRCQTLSRVALTAWRNTNAKIDLCVPQLGPCGSHTIGGGSPGPDVDALYVEMCMDATTRLAGRYPDSVQRVGSQRIVAAHVVLAPDGRGGDLTVTFYGGGRVRVPLDVRATVACAKPCPPDPYGLGLAGDGAAGGAHAPTAKRVLPAAPSAEETGMRKPHGPFGLHTLRVRNQHPTKRVRKVTAHAAEDKAANAPVGSSPLVVRNVAPMVPNATNLVEGDEYARVVHVTVCMEGGETLQARVTATADGTASLFELVEVTVGQDFSGAATLMVSDAVLHDLSAFSWVPETYAEVTCSQALETVHVTNSRLPAQTVAVRVLAGGASVMLEGGNPFVTPGGQQRSGLTVTDEPRQQLILRVCTGVAGKNLNFPLQAAEGTYIRTVQVDVVPNGDTVVTGEDWTGAPITAGQPSAASPCP